MANEGKYIARLSTPQVNNKVGNGALKFAPDQFGSL